MDGRGTAAGIDVIVTPSSFGKTTHELHNLEAGSEPEGSLSPRGQGARRELSSSVAKW